MIPAHGPSFAVFFLVLAASATAQRTAKLGTTHLEDTSKQQNPVHQASSSGILAKVSRLEAALEVITAQLDILLSGQKEFETIIIDGFQMLNETLAEMKGCLNCPQSTPPMTCPTGYNKYVNDTCGNSCYRYESSQCKSWNDARQTCRNEGGDLMIPTECSYQFFREQAKQHEGTCSHFWIGGYTNTPGYNYVTVKGEPISTSFSYWSVSQPDGGVESCLEMRSDFTNYLMNDFYCNVAEGFICQIFP